MSILDALSESFNIGRNRARNEATESRVTNIPIKVLEPSVGRIVRLEVTESRETLAKIYKQQLQDYANCIKKLGGQCEWESNGKVLKITYPNGDQAENARKKWEKRN